MSNGPSLKITDRLPKRQYRKIGTLGVHTRPETMKPKIYKGRIDGDSYYTM